MTNQDPISDRRQLLKRIGTTASVISAGGIAGCLDQTAGSSTSESTTTTNEDAASPGQSGIHPQYGFIGESMESPPPVEPDSEVELLIGERENGPVPEFYFEPTGLYVEPGDVVKFAFATPDHSVTAYHAALGRTPRVPEDVSALSSPTMTAGTYWLYEFDVEGVYDLYCPPHETFGMAMRVVAGNPSGPGTEPVEMGPPEHGEPRPPMQTAATVLSDDALAPGTITDGEAIEWADLDPESKRLRGQ